MLRSATFILSVFKVSATINEILVIFILLFNFSTERIHRHLMTGCQWEIFSLACFCCSGYVLLLSLITNSSLLLSLLANETFQMLQMSYKTDFHREKMNLTIFSRPIFEKYHTIFPFHLKHFSHFFLKHLSFLLSTFSAILISFKSFACVNDYIALCHKWPSG